VTRTYTWKRIGWRGSWALVMAALLLFSSLTLSAGGRVGAMQTPPDEAERARDEEQADRDRQPSERDDTAPEANRSGRDNDAATDGGNRGGQPVIVTLAPGADAAAVARELGVTPDFVYDDAINGFAATLPAQAVDALQRSRSAIQITPDLPVEAHIQDDAVQDEGRRRDRRRQRQTLPTGINRIDADTSDLAEINRGGALADVDVAVLDSGIVGHPDLNIAGGTSCRPEPGFRDRYGHGTHIAGTIGARDNKRGVVGVAPGARMWGVKVLNDRGSGNFSNVICGLEWVLETQGTADAIDVVNMSLSGDGPESTCVTDAFHEAVCNVVAAGVTVVVSAGNDQEDASSQVPANFDEVITVSAMTDFNGRPGGRAAPTCLRNASDDTFARGYSNFGADVDFVAPGSCIRSTWTDKEYHVLTGTSMAAPHVAGAAAAYIAKNPNATPVQVRAWLEDDASRPQRDREVGLKRDFDPDRIPERILYLGNT